jgi:signal transduction histidine kinase
LEQAAVPAREHSGSEHAWERYRPWWHAGFAATVAVTASWSAVELRDDQARLLTMMGLLGCFALWYALTPGKFESSPEGNCKFPSKHRGGLIYLAGAFSLFAAATFVYPGAGFLLFALVPHCFMMLRPRPAFVAVIGLTAVNVGAQLAYGRFDAATVASLSLFGVLTLLLALLLGGYINRIIEQSYLRAALIDELERTRAELVEMSREAGALAERERLAQEIHDALAQGFTSVIMLVQAAEAALERADLTAVRRQLAIADLAARDGLAEARSLIGALVPPALQGASLSDAVGRACEDLGARFGFTAHLEVEGDAVALSHNAEIVLLRAVQEALANVGKHARASSASVVLAFGEKVATLVVTDDGIGFDPERAVGFGLGQLRSRATQVGGQAEISSRVGGGTTVRVTIPLVALPRPSVPSEQGRAEPRAVKVSPSSSAPGVGVR